MFYAKAKKEKKNIENIWNQNHFIYTEIHKTSHNQWLVTHIFAVHLSQRVRSFLIQYQKKMYQDLEMNFRTRGDVFIGPTHRKGHTIYVYFFYQLAVLGITPSGEAVWRHQW